MYPANKIIWSKEEIEFLKANWRTMTNTQLQKTLNKKSSTLATKKHELGILKMQLIPEKWTPEQVTFLKKNYLLYGDKELAEIFNKKWHKNKGWKKGQIEKKRQYLNLKRTPEQLKLIKQRAVEKGVYHIANKKRWALYAAKPGEIRIWQPNTGLPWMVIKTATGFVGYSRYIYEREIGPIPSGFVVRYKDGDPLNVCKENLELISRRENAILNSRNRNDLKMKRQQIKNKINMQLITLKKMQHEK